jgi:predicted NBD/HSP70 family sugar kinase
MALAIGIDLGGTKIKGVLVNEHRRVIDTYRRATEAEEPKDKIIENIVEVINTLRKNAGDTASILGVGVSHPGFCLPNGKLASTPNIKNLSNVNLQKELEKKTGLKVFTENDANCFALAEQKNGAAKGCKNVIGVIIGTGVGGGLILDDKLYKGSLGGAGEIGHTKLVINPESCEAKEVEDLISGPAIIKKYEALSGMHADSPRIILEKKNAHARKAYEETVFYTGLFFANLINTFNPDAIVVGGGVSNLPYYADVAKVVYKYSFLQMAKCCKIAKNKLGDDSGAIGAAELVFAHACDNSQ